MTVRAALFDFDGTLADSFAAITASTNHVRNHYGLPSIPESEVRGYVGYGLADLIRNLIPMAPPDEGIALYREHHQTVMLTMTRLLPGVAETIPELARRGLKMAVCSNKRVEFTRQLVTALGLGEYFVAVLGPEDVGNQPKPHPAMVLEGLVRVGASATEAVYVGDMSIDVHTARAAGVPVWLVLGGAAGHEDATASNPDRVLPHFGELLGLLPRSCEMIVFLFLAVHLSEARWATLLACPKVSAPGTADGTGVVVGVKDGFAYVLSAAHVAQSDLVTLKFTSRANYPKAAWYGDDAVVIERWPDPDFSLIKFPVGKRAVPIIPLAPAWERPKAFPVAALSVGVGRGQASTAWDDVVLGKEFVRREGKGPAFFWRTKVPPEPGRSGGPLLDVQGRVIGIAVAFRGDVGYYSHHDEILAALKRDGYGWLIPTTKP